MGLLRNRISPTRSIIVAFSEFYQLNDIVLAQIKDRTGNYRLKKTMNGPVVYVGRSDSELAKRIWSHIQEGYKAFSYQYCDSPIAAFHQECADYHDFNATINNKIHPACPKGLYLKCPVCHQ
jgi:hypothetical protein